MKKCSKCAKIKSLDLFKKKRQRKDGVDSICKECESLAYYKLKYGEDAEAVMKNNKRLRLLSKVKKEVIDISDKATIDHFEKVHTYQKYLPNPYEIRLMMNRRILDLID